MKKKKSKKGITWSSSFFCINSLPNNKFLDWSNFKAYADDKINVTETLKFVLGRVENIVEKGENAGYQHFLLFTHCFQKDPFSRLLKVHIVLRVNVST